MACGGSSNRELDDQIDGLTLGENVDNVASVGIDNSDEHSSSDENESAREIKKIEKYTMNKENRRVAIIFYHTTYITREPKPDETNKNYTLDARTDTKDRNKLKKAFTKLGFDVEACEDFEWTKIQRKLIPDDTTHYNNVDCLIVAVLTHGGKTGYLEAKDHGYNVIQLVDVLSNREDLMGKPKLFFIQASRTKKKYRYNEKPNDGRGPNHTSLCAVATHPDFLMSFEGQYGYGNLQEVSPCTKILCKLLKKHHTDMDLVKLLTIVNREVAQSFSTTSHCFTSSLTKDLYL